MSTQAIRDVILRYRTCLGGKARPSDAVAIKRATEEVEAIEAAAREFYAKGEDADLSAWALMDEIFEDASSMKPLKGAK